MKKTIAAMLLACVLMLCGALASAEINVTMRGLNQARGLDKNVNHILVLLQDGDTTDTAMLASINGKTGRSVMTRIDCSRMIEVTADDGSVLEVAMGDTYALGGRKSKGLLVCREMNEMLGLDISTYVALDISQLPKLVDSLGTITLPLTEAEASALSKPWDYCEMTGEEVLAFVRLELEGDDPARSRSYEALMQMAKQALKGGDIMGMVSMATKLLKSMDTNVNVMSAMTLASAVQAGEDRREALVDAVMSEEDVRTMMRTTIYE